MPVPFPFLNLPLELRRLVYDHVIDGIVPKEDTLVYHIILSDTDNLFDIPLLSTNKQVYEELLEQLRIRDTVCIRITWQDLNFDALTILSQIIEARG